MKVMTILGTRPEIIRLSRVIARLEETSVVDHVLVHTGQNYDYELNQVFFDDLGLRKPDRFLDATPRRLDVSTATSSSSPKRSCASWSQMRF